MSNDPRVTVVIAAYECPGPLRLALESVRAQLFQSWELRVIGDGCQDQSAAVVTECGDPRVFWTNLPRNSGSQSAPNNEGIRQALGEYVAYLGQDDLWLPNHLAELVPLMDRTGADFGHALGVRIGPTGPISFTGETALTGELVGRRPPPTTWLHRRTVVDRAGWWADHRTVGEAVDNEFRHRAIRAGATTVFSPTLTALKFPAALFKIYTATGTPPQHPYFDRMSDPSALAAELLASVPDPASLPRKSLVRRVGRRVVHAVLSFEDSLERRFGADQWLLRAIRYGTFHWRRRRYLALKGLAPAWIARTTRRPPNDR